MSSWNAQISWGEHTSYRAFEVEPSPFDGTEDPFERLDEVVSNVRVEYFDDETGTPKPWCDPPDKIILERVS